MKAAIISLGSVSSKWLLTAMKKYFDSVDDINIREIEVSIGKREPEILYKGKPLGRYDCIYVKGSFRYNPLLRSITSIISGATYMPIEAQAFTLGHDKILTHLELEKHGIPMPRTHLSATTKAAKRILEKVNYPIIMKFPEGTQGKGVMVADSFASASSMLDALTALKQPFMIQEYVETGGTDIRAIVVGDSVVASMKRKAVEGEKRANIHAGATGEACTLNEQAKKIAVSASKAIGAEICAVDILEGAKGPLVIELNLSPGLQGITKATKIDVADVIAKFLYKKAKEHTECKKSIGAKKILEEIGIEKRDSFNNVITALNFRGSRILLPETITKATKFNDKDEYMVYSEEGKLTIMKFSSESKKK